MTAQELIDNSILKFVGKIIKHIEWDIDVAVVTFSDDSKMYISANYDKQDCWLNIQ